MGSSALYVGNIGMMLGNDNIILPGDNMCGELGDCCGDKRLEAMMDMNNVGFNLLHIITISSAYVV